jgi:hypothetical protein
MGELVGAFVQLLVSERGRPGLQRQRIGAQGCLAFELAVNAIVEPRWGGGVCGHTVERRKAMAAAPRLFLAPKKEAAKSIASTIPNRNKALVLNRWRS